jgi:hypothetical protein
MAGRCDDQEGSFATSAALCRGDRLHRDLDRDCGDELGPGAAPTADADADSDDARADASSDTTAAASSSNADPAASADPDADAHASAQTTDLRWRAVSLNL